MQKFRVHQTFIVGVVMIGGLIGIFNEPDGWYAALNKPSFNPPGIIFVPVWMTLYFFIAIAGAQTLIADRNSRRMKIWYAQMLLNFVWTPAFFGLHSPLLGLVIIALLLVAILAFIRESWQPDRTSAIFFIVYAAWVAFAALLNLSIVLLN
ncbi:tryptophan-rich sensory protein [Rhizobium sp. XQZ8]|uniref:TspO/MBR family protein n=1 Tax=Rhizobium populisoli TaxID=2859785 RepID=UPI001C680A64|nr:TspO/MBR family protein [Rhizobium populisoli]MBW6423440.1 tryptophan-rich sensory protein [Rhizobium populisoli]